MIKQEPTNLHSKATEDATYIPSDPSGCEKDTVEMDNFKSTEESKDENEDLRHLSGSADTAKDYLQATNCVGTESNDLMEQDLVDQSSKASRDHISISTSTTVEG